jgi:nucleotide-binding universal stress UspA family protein
MAFPDGSVLLPTPEESVELMRSAGAALDAAKRGCSGLVTTHLLEGSVPEAIVGAVGPDDLLIMGTHGRKGLSHLLLGSVAEKVVRAAKCPVLTVGSAAVGARQIAQPLRQQSA